MICWKSGVSTKNRLVFKLLLIAIILLAIVMVFWLNLLQILPLSIAYPMLSINLVIYYTDWKIYLSREDQY